MTGQRRVLIAAIGHYSDPGLRALRAPSRDANALAAVLGDPGIGEFEVTTVADCTAQELRVAIDEFYGEAAPEDLLMLHLSCHGVKDSDSELYFAARDTKIARLASTAVSADWVTVQMVHSRSRQSVLFLDCCFSGSFDRGMIARAAGDIDIQGHFAKLEGRGRAVITASSALEYAFEGTELQDDQSSGTSVFTTALVEGLRSGEADLDGDGLVSLDELYDFLYSRVRRATSKQTPTKSLYGLHGALYIAHRAGGPLPKPLPDELSGALTSHLASVRRGVIEDLVALAGGADRRLADSAREGLQSLCRDDSRSVAAAAAAALAQLGAGTAVLPRGDSVRLAGTAPESGSSPDKPRGQAVVGISSPVGGASAGLGAMVRVLPQLFLAAGLVALIVAFCIPWFKGPHGLYEDSYLQVMRFFLSPHPDVAGSYFFGPVGIAILIVAVVVQLVAFRMRRTVIAACALSAATTIAVAVAIGEATQSVSRHNFMSWNQAHPNRLAPHVAEILFGWLLAVVGMVLLAVAVVLQQLAQRRAGRRTGGRWLDRLRSGDQLGSKVGEARQ